MGMYVDIITIQLMINVATVDIIWIWFSFWVYGGDRTRAQMYLSTSRDDIPCFFFFQLRMIIVGYYACIHQHLDFFFDLFSFLFFASFVFFFLFSFLGMATNQKRFWYISFSSFVICGSTRTQKFFFLFWIFFKKKKQKKQIHCYPKSSDQLCFDYSADLVLNLIIKQVCF